MGKIKEYFANKRRKKEEQIAIYSILAAGQRAGAGERLENCSGVPNNAQKLAILQLLRGDDNESKSGGD